MLIKVYHKLKMNIVHSIINGDLCSLIFHALPFFITRGTR